MSFIKSLLDEVFPNTCMICHKRTWNDNSDFCIFCNMMLPRTGFYKNPYENRMAKMYWGRAKVEKVAAWIYYTPQTLITRMFYEFKYNGYGSLAYRLGYDMAMDMGREGFFDDIDIIVPLPITRKRRRKRGYNQSELIAWGISVATGIPVVADAVNRELFKTSQTRLARDERQENVEDVFFLYKPEKIQSRHVLLVDDIVTTGATTVSCLNALANAEDAKFSVLSLGYTRA